MFQVGILTLSDLGSRGQREDTSSQAIRDLLPKDRYVVASYAILPDEAPQISERLREWSDVARLDLILTTGGTGFGPRDVTPEATLAVLDRAAPGLAEAMRSATLAKTPMAMLSRQVAGVRGRTLIVNLPGSPRGTRECLEVILPVLPHALELLKDQARGHPGAGA